MISPNFENCQIGVDYATGQILALSESARDWIGATNVNKSHENYLFICIHLGKSCYQKKRSKFIQYISSDRFKFFWALCKYCSLQR